MCTAVDLIREKTGDLAALPPEATALEAAHLMNDRRIGSVLVMDGAPARDARLLGIFTERDVLRRIVACRRDPQTTRLQQVMTTPVACAAPHTLLDELRLAMRNRGIRHIPVVDDTGRVLGMISLGDLNRAGNTVREQTIHFLDQFVAVT